MVNIDYIMELLDWNNSVEEQSHGIILAQNVRCINVFLQPGSPYGKNVWENCAIILSKKADEELNPYLFDLLDWLQDMNWPGAFCILERLQKHSDKKIVSFAVKQRINQARLLKDEIWESNLHMIEVV